MRYCVFIGHLAAGLLLLVSSLTCRSNKQDISPSDETRLLSVDIPGFPAENIAIDHDKKQAVLTAPATVTAVSFAITSFRTSPGSAVWRGNESQFPVNLCAMPNHFINRSTWSLPTQCNGYLSQWAGTGKRTR